MVSAVGCWSRGDDESEEVGGRGSLFSSSSQAVFLSFSQIYFLSAEVKRGGCCSDDSYVHANRDRGSRWLFGTENLLQDSFKTNKLPFCIYFTAHWVCFHLVFDPIYHHINPLI